MRRLEAPDVRPVRKPVGVRGRYAGMRIKTRIAALVSVVALLVAGCGSEDASSGTKPAATATAAAESAPTMSEYVAQVNDICAGKGDRAAKTKSRDLNRAVAKTGRDLNAALESGRPTAAILDRVGRQHIEIAESREHVSERVRDLTPPSEGAPEAFLRAFDDVAVAIRTFGEDAQKMDGPRNTWMQRFNAEVNAINRASARFVKKARALGAKRCAV